MKVRVEVEGIAEETPETKEAAKKGTKEGQPERKAPGFPDLAKTETEDGPTFDNTSDDYLLNPNETKPKTDETFKVLDVEPGSTVQSILDEAEVDPKGRYVTVNNVFRDLNFEVRDEDSYILLKLRK